ncbi:ralA-binding protein 1 isoform X1 [Nasonia vitripennis]|uniref:Rho-GAP domain-containing protein n=1 Tax=Nasonia vitripennis TaxID=7425 RepID=A0A7M7TE40_NASVI|nr:ralA-binding protein 1 isoform X1 [Nasonia vitripennis]XP_032456821.1 ralA-binding protein 1 isoform X1 [Nasonia vitripennis]
MDFESPDVEKEFPGLYASDAAKKSESDFSDDGVHDKHSKKELLGGSKKKDKKDKKDRGYATLEGESSADEEETKSPSKSKSKTKAFKFPSKSREKREKSREKDVKEKDSDKEKKKKDKDVDKEVDKEKRKEKDKVKQKHKDRKKGKHGDDALDIGEEEPIFGVSLHLAVERSRCHDGVELPLVVRDCIDYLEEHGMSVEGLYKVPGNKSKVQHLKKLYNQREPVNMSEFEPNVATSLLLHFIKELPEPVLESSELISRFEQAASTKELAQRESQLADLANHQLADCNRVLLAWITLHLDHVTTCEKTTKMNAQTIAMTLSPALQMSHRLLLALLFHCKALFPEVRLTKYVPPLPAGSTRLPETPQGIAAELAKQESLLSQIHMLMNAGYVNKSREEQLWEVQRMITQLKRKYKLVQKLEGSIQKSLDEEVPKPTEESQSHVPERQPHLQEKQPQLQERQSQLPESQPTKIAIKTEDESDRLKVSETSKEAPRRLSTENINHSAPLAEKYIVDKVSKISTDTTDSKTEAVHVASNKPEENAVAVESEKVEEPVVENETDRLRESLIYEELLNMQASLKTRISQERHEIERLNEMLLERINSGKSKAPVIDRTHSPSEAEMTAMIQLVSENQLLEKKMTTLIRSIVEEKDTCVELRVQLALHQLLMAQKNKNSIKQI